MNATVTVIILVLLLVGLKKCTPYDSTDDAANGTRSGMRLYTDHATGLQYLSGPFGIGLTPRMGPDGKQLADPR